MNFTTGFWNSQQNGYLHHPLVATRELLCQDCQGMAQVPLGDSSATQLQCGSASCTRSGCRPHEVNHRDTEKPEGVDGKRQHHSWLHGHRHWLAAVKASHHNRILCLVHMFHLVVKDAMGLESAVKATCDAPTLKMQSLL